MVLMFILNFNVDFQNEEIVWYRLHIFEISKTIWCLFSLTIDWAEHTYKVNIAILMEDLPSSKTIRNLN